MTARVPLCSAVLFLAAPLALAQTPRSPFLPPEVESAPVAAEDAPLQFIGFFGEGESARYCVYDPARRRSVWLRAGDQDGAIQVQSFDRDTRTVNVVHQGRTMTLKLQSAKLANAGAPGAPTVGPLPVAGAQPGGNNPLVNTVVTNPTPADEARRLEAVAAEVRRRRALRQAAAQNQGQPPTPVEGQRLNPQ